MNRARLLQALRIAWTASWSVAVVLLVVLWVRSFWWRDSGAFLSGSVFAYSLERKLHIVLFPSGTIPAWAWGVHSTVLNQVSPLALGGPSWYFAVQNGTVVGVSPHWFPGIVLSSLAGLPWFSWPTRFSLRTLIITMTLVATLLGLIVWAINR
jgi:hypothetical protein